jgi:hypothetical protein
MNMYGTYKANKYWASLYEKFDFSSLYVADNNRSKIWSGVTFFGQLLETSHKKNWFEQLRFIVLSSCTFWESVNQLWFNQLQFEQLT